MFYLYFFLDQYYYSRTFSLDLKSVLQKFLLKYEILLICLSSILSKFDCQSYLKKLFSYNRSVISANILFLNGEYLKLILGSVKVSESLTDQF